MSLSLSENTRAGLFFFGCLPVRTLVANYARTADESTLDMMRLAATLPAGVWLSGAIDNKEVGTFGGEAWWKELRPLHGTMYALFAASGRWEFLGADAALGLFVGVRHFLI
jgi:hypothetical protein